MTTKALLAKILGISMFGYLIGIALIGKWLLYNLIFYQIYLEILPL
jgi:hypothetical protein